MLKRIVLSACSVALLVGVTATPSTAQPLDKRTLFTFSGPVSMPGVTLPAGEYLFRLANPDSSARVVQVLSADGTKPYGLMVFIEPESNGTGNIRGNWKDDLGARKLIWVAAMKSGNDQQGERRVWLAQQARAWALHHYNIDTGRMIISGFSNGGDAASATAVATPFGFNNALLIAPPCEPPVGTVHVPREHGGGTTATVQPLSSSGISGFLTSCGWLHSIPKTV